MPSREWHCHAPGCDEHGTQTKPSRPRKWCSDRCRKTQYDLVCGDCGGRVYGSNPGRMADRSRPRCAQCTVAHSTVWTPDAIVCAIQEWADEHGGVPPTATDSFTSGRDALPAVTTVQKAMGSWNAAIIAAGFEPHAIGPVGGYDPLTPEQRRACAERYAAGESGPQIAAAFGCSVGVVYKWARRHGVDVRESFSHRKAA